MRLSHKFIKTVPEKLEKGVLYVSVEYASVIHLCGCGCGNEVVTPLSPKDWKLTFDGEAISLSPSIGNWSFKCQSHYWIKRNFVEWAPKWDKEQTSTDKKKKALGKKVQKGRGSLFLGDFFKGKQN